METKTRQGNEAAQKRKQEVRRAPKGSLLIQVDRRSTRHRPTTAGAMDLRKQIERTGLEGGNHKAEEPVVGCAGKG